MPALPGGSLLDGPTIQRIPAGICPACLRRLERRGRGRTSGGCVRPPQPSFDAAAVAGVSAGAGVATHMDGARLLNAVVKTGVSASDYTQGYDSVTICFTKGLGCPFGALLVGSEEFVRRAWRFRQLLGGGLRQSGFMAALCLYAFDHNVERLADDHRRAAQVASTLRDLELVGKGPTGGNQHRDL